MKDGEWVINMSKPSEGCVCDAQGIMWWGTSSAFYDHDTVKGRATLFWTDCCQQTYARLPDGSLFTMERVA